MASSHFPVTVTASALRARTPQPTKAAATPDQVALTVRTTVVSNAVTGQVVLDAGAKVLAMDRLAFIDTHGLVPAYPEARLTRMWNITVSSRSLTGHHARPSANGSTSSPNHFCATVN